MNTEQKISQIDKLKRQKETLLAKIQKEEARLKQQERKNDTRRKILLGSLLLDKLKKEGSFESIRQELDVFLTRNNDRTLFDLSPIENEATST
jgi:hypothetical protein